MSLCPARPYPADTQAGSLASAARSVMVSWGLESPGEEQALAQERLGRGAGAGVCNCRQLP